MKVGDLVVNLFRRDVPEGHPVLADPSYVNSMDKVLCGKIIFEGDDGIFEVKALSGRRSSLWQFHPSWIAPFSPENLNHFTEEQLLTLLKHSSDLKDAS